MPIPDYQSLMLPLLRLTQDGNEHCIGDAVQQLASKFGLCCNGLRILPRLSLRA
jgi:restriction system protein